MKEEKKRSVSTDLTFTRIRNVLVERKSFHFEENEQTKKKCRVNDGLHLDYSSCPI